MLAYPPEAIGYVNPHGSASIQNDKVETLAIKTVFGDHAYQLSASSTKSMIGHSLGACGALEFVSLCSDVDHQYVHPTINHVEPDPECDLDFVPNVGRAQSIANISQYRADLVALMPLACLETEYWSVSWYTVNYSLGPFILRGRTIRPVSGRNKSAN